MCKKSLLLLFLLPFQFVFAQTSLLTDFPEGYTPKEVGKRLAYHFVDGKHMLHIGKWISYPETFTWNGGLKFAALTTRFTKLPSNASNASLPLVAVTTAYWDDN